MSADGLTLVAAVAADGTRAIGRRGELLCHLPADLRHFRAVTMGHPVVMGRVTYESLPGRRPLPGRRNIIVSGTLAGGPEGAPEGFEVYPTVDEALEAAGPRAMVMGGGRLYAATIGRASRLELTELSGVDTDGADAWFPEVDPGQWRVAAQGPWQQDPAAPGVRYRFSCLERRE